MSDLLDDLKLEDLTGSVRELADVIGIEAFKRMVRVYGGSSYIYVPMENTVTIPARNRQIVAAYLDGAEIRRLAIRYGVTDRCIRDIVRDAAERIDKQPLNGQVFFDDLEPNN